jgi:surface carbohydrate biosynthesis protein
MKILFMPIEDSARELDYKLALSTILVDEDTVVYIGQHDYLYKIRKAFKGGVYLGKNIFSYRSDGTWQNRHKDIKKRGVSVIHLDEEQAIYSGDKEEWKRRLSTRLDLTGLDSDDFLFVWGDFQKKYYENVTNVAKENIVVTGNPRFDLLSKYKKYYEDDIKEFTKKYGEYILVTTSFGWFNNILGNKDTFSNRFRADLSDMNRLREHIGTWAYYGKTFIGYVELIADLSKKYPNNTIIVRPHPSEIKEIYQTIFKGMINVRVVYYESSYPWIIGAKLLIEDGSSTAVEAYLSDTPVINYKPESLNNNYDMYLPDLVSVKCTQKEEVFSKISEISNGTSRSKIIDDELAHSLFFNLKDTHDSFSKTSDTIKKVLTKEGDGVTNNLLLWFYRLKLFLVEIIRKLLLIAHREKRKRYNINRIKFSGFLKDRVARKSNKLCQMFDKSISCNVVNDNLIILKKNK